MSDIAWPAWSRSGEQILGMLPALRRPRFTRAEVIALADAHVRSWQDPARGEAWTGVFAAFHALERNTILEDARRVARKRALASGEWRDDLLYAASEAAAEAAVARASTGAVEPAWVALLEKAWVDVMESPGRQVPQPFFGAPAAHPDPASVDRFVAGQGWDEGYARRCTASSRTRDALKRCREATWAAGWDHVAQAAVARLSDIPTPGGCWPDEATMLVDAFFGDLGRVTEAVVALDLLDPADYALLTATYRGSSAEPSREDAS